ncbi:MAG: FliM/FliN family flagellar motor switch protein [Gammaproteobacteria bacterium]|nr:FliM/FliN family flagellar motor switch protein [Gammaproteobacteria bacterium]
MVVKNVELGEFFIEEDQGKKLLDNDMELIRNVKVSLEVRLGDSEMTVGELYDLKENEVLQLNQEINAPVDIILDGKVVARGNLVAVDNNYGVQVTDIQK